MYPKPFQIGVLAENSYLGIWITLKIEFICGLFVVPDDSCLDCLQNWIPNFYFFTRIELYILGSPGHILIKIKIFNTPGIRVSSGGGEQTLAVNPPRKKHIFTLVCFWRTYAVKWVISFSRTGVLVLNFFFLNLDPNTTFAFVSLLACLYLRKYLFQNIDPSKNNTSRGVWKCEIVGIVFFFRWILVILKK